MRVAFVKEKPKNARVEKDIKKATGAEVVTTDTSVCIPEHAFNEYGRAEADRDRK